MRNPPLGKGEGFSCSSIQPENSTVYIVAKALFLKEHSGAVSTDDFGGQHRFSADGFAVQNIQQHAGRRQTDLG